MLCKSAGTWKKPCIVLTFNDKWLALQKGKGMDTLLSNLNTKLYLRAPNEKTADWVSKNIGTYEYEEVKLPIDIITGDKKIREMIEADKTIADIEKYCEEEIKSFLKIREKYLLY